MTLFVHVAPIDVFFALLNFFILCVVIRFAWRRFVVPRVHFRMKEREERQQFFVERTHQLNTTLQRLDKAKQEQEEMYRHLEKKVTAWKDFFTQDRARIVQQQQLMSETIRARRHRQQEHQEQERLAQDIFPQALERASRELKDYFKNDRMQQHYMHHLLTTMKEIS